MSYVQRILEIPLGHDGLIGTRNLSRVPPTALIQATNLTYENGTLQKEAGAQRYNPTPLAGATFLGGWDWWPSPGQQRMIVYVAIGGAGSIRKDNGGGTFSTILKSGVPAGVMPIFVEGGAEMPGNPRKLFIFAPGMPTQVLYGDAATTVDIGLTGISAPGAPTAALFVPATAGTITAGAHQWAVTFITADGETTLGEASNTLTIVNPATDGWVTLSGIAIGPPGTTQRRVYQTKAADPTTFYALTTLMDNSTTEIALSTEDALLGAEPPTENTTRSRPPEWTGTTWPSFGALHDNRLWVGGFDEHFHEHRLYYSTPDDHENFVDEAAGSVSVYPGESERIISITSYKKGLLVAWKYPKGIYLINTSDPDPQAWTVTRHSFAFGAVSRLGQVLTDEDILFLDPNGEFQFLSAVQEFGDVGGRSLSQVLEMNPLIRAQFNMARLNLVQAVYHAKKRTVHYAMPSTTSAVNDRRLAIDLNRAQRPRFRISDRDVCVSLWLRKEGDNTQGLVAGDDTGTVWQLDRDDRSKDGVGYEGRFQTAHTDFSELDPVLATRQKHADFLELVIEPKGNFDLTVDVLWDGIRRETVAFSMAGVWVAGAGDVLNKKRRLRSQGRRLSLIGYNSGVSQDFSIARAYLHTRISDERLRHESNRLRFLILVDQEGHPWWIYADPGPALWVQNFPPEGGYFPKSGTYQWLEWEDEVGTFWKIYPAPMPAGTVSGQLIVAPMSEALSGVGVTADQLNSPPFVDQVGNPWYLHVYSNQQLELADQP